MVKSVCADIVRCWLLSVAQGGKIGCSRSRMQLSPEARRLCAQKGKIASLCIPPTCSLHSVHKDGVFTSLVAISLQSFVLSKYNLSIQWCINASIPLRVNNSFEVGFLEGFWTSCFFYSLRQGCPNYSAKGRGAAGFCSNQATPDMTHLINWSESSDSCSNRVRLIGCSHKGTLQNGSDIPGLVLRLNPLTLEQTLFLFVPLSLHTRRLYKHVWVAKNKASNKCHCSLMTHNQPEAPFL